MYNEPPCTKDAGGGSHVYLRHLPRTRAVQSGGHKHAAMFIDEADPDIGSITSRGQAGRLTGVCRGVDSGGIFSEGNTVT